MDGIKKMKLVLNRFMIIETGLSFFLLSFCFADGQVDEDAMFSDTQTVVDNAKILSVFPASEEGKISFGISGDINGGTDFTLMREEDDNELELFLLGNVFLDGRLSNGYKAFGNVESRYFSRNGEWNIAARELFFDLHYENKIYFRIGKQVLQWGRCYLWNPTDLINAEKLTFEKRIGYRDGVYGLRIHQPFGTEWNWYAFIHTGKRVESDEIAGAFKLETLIGNTEFSVSVWDKKHAQTVYGADFSTRICKIDVSGEISTSHGWNADMMEEKNGILFIEKKDDGWFTRASLNLGKQFDFNDQNDKISVAGEYFYNQAGYGENIFRDKKMYLYQTPVMVESMPISVYSGDKKTFFLLNHLFEMNYYSRHYGALFISVKEFFTSSHTLNLNCLSNLDDGSAMISLGLDYININDWNMSLIYYCYAGPSDCEYTFLRPAGMMHLVIGVKF
ncbi:MAG: hypothetical protein JW774_11785 [Candidatus Aureabacteria bacterium]|nr:hypothetical protein [Candidatus Auribacterota bacterium]